MVGMLDVAGLLEPDEEQTYRVLVRLTAARPGDIAEQLSLSQEEAHRLLKALSEKGLAVVDHGAGDVVRPLPPEPALGAVLLKRQESLESARRTLVALGEEFRASRRRHQADRLVEIVVGVTALRERLRHLQDSARTEMMWFCRANTVAMSSAENIEEFDALDRGVRYRVIYERPLLQEPGMLENVAEGVRRGENARTLPSLPVRLAIADRATAICPLVRGDKHDFGKPSAAVIEGSQLLDALVALFERHWDLATPVRLGSGGNTPHSAGGEPDEAERFLLSLLVAGVPDKSIASQMGVSRRTVQRRIDRLMTLAAVDTRAALAFQAARRGWL
jgi:DNA-binding MarR family transcriptional regulator